MGILSDKAKQPAGLLSPARMATQPLTGGLLAQMQALQPEEVQRAYLFPWGRVNGQLQAMVPGAVMDAYNAFALPGRVYRGEEQIYDENGRVRDEVIKGATDLAGMVTLGSGAVPAKAGEMRAGIKAYKGAHPYLGGPVTDFYGRVIEERPMKRLMIDEPFNSPGKPYAGFFSDDPAVASSFARALSRDGGAVFPVEIDMKNPKIIDAGGSRAAKFQFGDGVQHAFLKYFEDHDGVILKNTSDEGTVYIPRQDAEIRSIFDPEIIKKVRKYGIAAAVAMGLVSQEDAQRMKEQGLVDG